MDTDAKRRSSKWLELFILVALAALVGALFPLTTIEFKADSVTYLREASRFAEDFSYGRDYRGPGMPAINALAIWIGGSGLSVIVMPRVAFAALILVFYGLGRRLYGALPAGLAAAALAVAPTVHYVGSFFHVDIFMIAWAVAALWALYEALSRRSAPLAALSGVLYAIAFLTKEVAILLLPMWLIGWLAVPPYDRALRRTVLVSLAAAFIAVLPWAVLVLADADPNYLLGRNVNRPEGSFAVFLRSLFDQPVAFLATIPGYFAEFYVENVLSLRGEGKSSAPFAWLPATGAAGLLVLLAVRQRSADFFVAFTIACFLPFILYLGFHDYDSRQSAVVFVFGFLAVPALLATLIPAPGAARDAAEDHGDSGQWGRAAARGTVALAILAGLIVLAAATPYVRATFEPGPRSYAAFTGARHVFSPTRLLPPVWVEAADWLAPRVKPDQKLMTLYARSKKAIDVLMPLEPVTAPTHKINLKFWLDNHFNAAGSDAGAPSGSASPEPLESTGNEAPRILMLRHHRPRLSQWSPCIDPEKIREVPGRFCRFHYMDERELLETIRAQQVRYIVVGPKRAFFAAYFDRHPGFSKVHEATAAVPYSDGKVDKVAVYEVVDPSPASDLVPFVTATMPQMLQLFERNWPEAYEAWRQGVLLGELGLSAGQYQSVFEGRANCFFHFDKGARSDLTDCRHADSPE